MGDGTKENPYTREDVLRLIGENGGKAEGLNLSHKIFVEAIDLNKFHLKGIHLSGAHLKRAHLMDADLTGAILYGAHLKGAGLTEANLELADFQDAVLDSVFLIDAVFSNNTKLSGVYWGNYVLGDETKDYYYDVINTYRRLKIWYTVHGEYDVAGEFFYREMEVKRKARNWKKRPHFKLWYWIIRILCGYGEKPERVFISAAAVLLVASLVYFLIGSTFDWSAFGRSLYFSVVSFTALGYGSWVSVDSNVIRGLGAAESFLGVFMMALFLVTFTRKMTR